MGTTRRVDLPRQKDRNSLSWSRRNSGPRNPDGTWVAGVVRGPYRPFPFPIGTQFGELTLVRYEHYTTPKGKLWGYRPVCRCSCGAETMVYINNLRNGRTTRCNKCAKIAASTKRYWRYKDAMADDEHRTRLLNRLSAAIARCSNPRNKQYKHYGLRGITVYSQWQSDRAAFLRYVQTLPGWDNPSLEMDRIDTNRGYEPGNIRFVSRRENIRNKRRIEDLEAIVRQLREENRRLRQRLRSSQRRTT